MIIQTTSSLVKIEELNATAAKLVDEPFRRCAGARIQPSKKKLKSYTSKDWGSEPLAEFSVCITKLSPAGLFRLLSSYQSTNQRRRPVP